MIHRFPNRRPYLRIWYFHNLSPERELANYPSLVLPWLEDSLFKVALAAH